MIAPIGAESFSEALRWGAEVYHALKKRAEGARAWPPASATRAASPRTCRVQPRRARPHPRGHRAGRLHPGEDIALALDVAASEFYEDGGYAFEGKAPDRRRDDRLLRRARRRRTRWSPSRTRSTRTTGTAGRPSPTGSATRSSSSATTCSSPTRSASPAASRTGTANALLVKVNQIGSLTETLDAVELAQRNGYQLHDVATAPARPRTSPSPTSPSPPTAARSRPAPRPAPSASPSTTSCCASRRSSTTPRSTPAPAPSRASPAASRAEPAAWPPGAPAVRRRDPRDVRAAGARVRPPGARPRRPAPVGDPRRAGAAALHHGRQGPPHPPRRGAAVDRRLPHGAARLDRRGSTSASSGDIAALQDKVAGAAAGRRRAQGRAGALARPGLRRAAGPAAAEVRQAGGAVLHRARRRAGDRHQRPRARAGRARRPLPWYETVWQSTRTADVPRGAPVTARRRPAARRAGRPRRRLPPARPPGPRRRRGRPPLPVRRARRRAHRAAAARRHALPDVVLRHLPPPHRRAVDPGEPGRHARDDRAARGRPRAARAATPRRTSTTSSAAPSSVTCPRSPGSRPAACRPGSSACTCSSPTRSPPGPGSTRSATRRSRCSTRWWAAAPRARPTLRTPRTPRRRPRRDGCRQRTVSDGIRPRVAAIDCGTNSLRLLVADVGDDGRLTDVVRRMEIVRLGQGIDRTGVIAPEAMARTLRRDPRVRRAVPGARAPSGCASSRPRPRATRATRGSSSPGCARRSATSTSRPRWSPATPRRGSRSPAPPATCGRVGVPGPYLVVDLGGGSTELVRGTDRRRGGPLGRRRQRADDRAAPARRPPDGRARWRPRGATSAAALDTVEETVDLTGIGAVVGLAGTITTITAHALAPAGVPARRHPPRAGAGRRHTGRRASRCSPWGTRERAALPYLHPGRVDVIAGGALVWEAVLERALLRSPGALVVTSEHDILDGIALSLT